MKPASTIVVTALVFGAAATLDLADKPTVDDVQVAQAGYFERHGKYLQILKDNRLPAYETGTVPQKLGRKIPDNVTVHVYDGPKGQGYILEYEDELARYSVGYGPQADDFSFIIPKTAAVASSTSQ